MAVLRLQMKIQSPECEELEYAEKRTCHDILLCRRKSDEFDCSILKTVSVEVARDRGRGRDAFGVLRVALQLGEKVKTGKQFPANEEHLQGNRQINGRKQARLR